MLIAHIVFRFDYGGLENGVVNVIKGLSGEPYQHTVIALTEATEFANRLPDGVEVHCIGKQPGKDLRAYLRLYKLLRAMGPDIVHTRNMGTMDCALVAYFAGVPIRIHGEHGWDVFDPDGTNVKYRLIRRFLYRFVHRIVTVSEDLKRWLERVVGIPEKKIQHICNGVDTARFAPRENAENSGSDSVVVGSVTRFSAIKDPLNLVDAFIKLRQNEVVDSSFIRLAMVGDGELHETALARLDYAGLQQAAWLPGSRNDIVEVLRSMDIFVLGSLKEGISNTILEAMACGLPVIASDTGGNGELVDDGVSGTIVPPGNSVALEAAISHYVLDPGRRLLHGSASRNRAVSRFSLTAMVENYRALYESAYARQRN